MASWTTRAQRWQVRRVLRVVGLCALVLVAACSRTAIEPSVSGNVACVRNAVADERAGLDVWDDVVAGYERADAESPPRSGQVVFIGSSSIVFWQSVAEDMAPLEVLNRGFGGSAARQATGYVDRLVLPYEPSAVVLYEGDNDIAFGMTPECVSSDVEDFVAAVHGARPDVPIYLLAVKPSIARAHLQERFVRTNELLAAFARETPLVFFVDVATPMLDADGKLREDLFAEDGLHMNEKGYEVWTSTLRPILLADPG